MGNGESLNTLGIIVIQKFTSGWLHLQRDEKALALGGLSFHYFFSLLC